MKAKKIMDSTNNSRVYKLYRNFYISGKEGYCGWCQMNRGCNKWHRRPQRNWKKYRKNQWK